MSSSRQSRRTAGVKPHEKFAELRALRESGKTRLSTYEVEEEEQLYEEVDEEGYRKIVRENFLKDDFVVDDQGEGYVDNGEDDEWERRGGRYSDEEGSQEEGRGGKKLTAKRRKEIEEARKKKKAEQEGSIAKYFNAAAGVVAKPKASAPTEDDEAFMANLLGDFDTTTTSTRGAGASAGSSRRSKPEPAVRKPRKASPPIRNKPRVKLEPESPAKGMRSSPPPMMAELEDDDEYDDDLVMNNNYDDDDDVEMGNAGAEPPTSPTLKAVQKKTGAMALKDDDDDDDFAVLEVKGAKGVRRQTVNIAASRPAPKPVKVEPPAKAAVENATIPLDNDWKKVTANLSVASLPGPESIGLGKINPKDAMEDDGTLNFFWTDYSEVNGSLCLFGKVKVKSTGKYVSCFVKLDGLMRNLYFLPREHRRRNGTVTDEEVEMSEVYDEVSSLMSKFHIKEFKAKPCTRKYAFELPDIPRECDYLKVLYPYDSPALDIDPDRYETFSHVFGTHTALFEQFVLCRNIMGPCWLSIKGGDFGAIINASWCKLEVQVNNPMQIERVDDSDSNAPPLTLMSICLRTKLNVRDNKQEIVVASARIYENVSLDDARTPEKLPSSTFTVIRPHNGMFPPGFEGAVKRHGPSIRAEQTEQALLNVFLAKLQNVDPDVIIGHDLENVDYSTLLHRMKELKTSQWHRIGRLKRSEWPKFHGRFAGTFYAERGLVSGRLMCDLANDLGKSLMTSCQSWSLTEMCDLMLKEKRLDTNTEASLKAMGSTAQGLLDYLGLCEVDTYYIAAIALKIQMLPLTKVLTNLAGNSWARTLSGTRAERNEYILLHEFYKSKYICPDKYTKTKKVDKKPVGKDEENPDNDDQAEAVKKKDTYKGGLVFEPTKGLYDKFILVMDFNSLYPSIIQEYNICFTTVERAELGHDTVPDVPSEEKPGILPKLISSLVERRKQVKGLMKDPTATETQKIQWDLKQLALKLTANSMYGCLGYDRSRFYARPLAMLTTFKGREILLSTKELAEELQLEVVYGDTDSVMINTNTLSYPDAMKVGNEFKKAVNKKYKKLEIDIDNVFQRLLLHAKKKYAALTLSEVNGKLVTKKEIKGLDMRRREYCKISKDASGHIIDEIFSGDPTEVVIDRIHDYLRELAAKIREGKFSVNEYTIFTKLGKEPEEYPGGQSMPHVQVALRKKARGEHVKVGDVISFIITGDGEGLDKNPAERAYATQDLISDSTLKPDYEWYLVKQIFPPIERLCAPIEGTDSMRIAECLGLDTRKYKISNRSDDAVETEISPLESTIPDEERFKEAEKLNLKCRGCKDSFIWEGIVDSRDHITAKGITCGKPGCKPLSIPSIVAQLECQLRHQTNLYYEGWLVCSDSSCGIRTRMMSVYGKRCLGAQGIARGCLGRMAYEYPSKKLYNQLLYFQSLFDMDKVKPKVEKLKDVDSETKEQIVAFATQNKIGFDVVKGCVDRYLEKCGRRWVSMESIFAFSAPVQAPQQPAQIA